MIIGDNFFEGLQVVFGTMTVWSEVCNCPMILDTSNTPIENSVVIIIINY